jgi:hydrogenase maturation protease
MFATMSVFPSAVDLLGTPSVKTKNKILILGVGNYLMGDEGFGVHFIQDLQKEHLPENVDILDGGTGGFQLLGYLEEYPTVIIIDATLDENPPGSIRLIEPKFAKDFPTSLSTHEIGLRDLVESLSLMGRLPKIYLYVVSVSDIAKLHVGLSKEVEQALPLLKVKLLRKLDAVNNDKRSEK